VGFGGFLDGFTFASKKQSINQSFISCVGNESEEQKQMDFYESTN